MRAEDLQAMPLSLAPEASEEAEQAGDQLLHLAVSQHLHWVSVGAGPQKGRPVCGLSLHVAGFLDVPMGCA